MKWAALALGCLSACGGEVGTIEVTLVTAPGSDLFERIESARATLSDPPTVVEAERDDDGDLRLDLELTAENGTALVVVEGFDGAGERIALGRSAPLPVSAVNAEVALYLAPPLSLAEAPVGLEPARSEIGAALLPYGAIFFGGREAGGDVVSDAVIYNVYDHALQIGMPMPEARAAVTVVAGEGDLVYLFGGLEQDGDASADGWSFNTSVAPDGAYAQLTSDGELARAGASGVLVGADVFLVTGAPAVQLNGPTGQVTAWPDAPPLADGAAARLVGDESVILVAGSGVGENGAVIHAGGAYSELEAPPEARRTGHAVVALPDGRGLILGGSLDPAEPARTAVIYDQDGGDFALEADFLATGRTQAAVAASATHVLVAGGTDATGAVIGDAELFDATSLAPVATLPMVAPRRGASALVLANGQILIAGGVDADGAPVGVLELFTPDE